ncbi:hypothetical protein CRENBAI_007090 [Crenichthys baileyi]|uniref:Uncharacterized protein n=1 Tax=Crenichthys baileyi TaxID=28760 RepID=A0AAV9SLT0_9TELE
MRNKVLSYLQTSSFRSSSPHIAPTETRIMTEGTSQRDQAGGMEREFKRGEILVKIFSHLVTSHCSPWRRLEIAGSLQDWLEVRKDFFLEPRIHHTIEAERHRALEEIVASMRRSPAPSSTHLSTEAQHGFPAHGYAPDQPSPLLPTHNPFPGPHIWSCSGGVPSRAVLTLPVREGLVDGLPPLPAPVPGPVLQGSEDELPPSLVPVPEEFVEDLSPLPLPVPEGCEDAPSPPAVFWRLRRRSPQPHRRSQWSLHRASELHRGFSWSRHRPSDHRLLRRRPADRLSYVLLIARSAGFGR